MADMERQASRITVDDLVSSVADGVLRALEARKLGQELGRSRNGFIVDIKIRCGGFPLPVDVGGFQGIENEVG